MMNRSDIANLSENELRGLLKENHISVAGPILPSTRGVYELLLLKSMSGDGGASGSDTDIQTASSYEPVVTRSPLNTPSFSQPGPTQSSTQPRYSETSYRENKSFQSTTYTSNYKPSPLARPPLGRTPSQNASNQTESKGMGSSTMIIVAVLCVVAGIVIYIMMSPSVHYPAIN